METKENVVNRVFKGTYQRSSGFVNQMIPTPTATRRANPYLAAVLELLGFVGVLGLGRMYAGDVAGGVKAMIMWFVALLTIGGVIGIGGLIAVLGVFFTFGLSLLLFAVLAVPVMIPWIVVPISSATSLFVALKRAGS